MNITNDVANEFEEDESRSKSSEENAMRDSQEEDIRAKPDAVP